MRRILVLACVIVGQAILYLGLAPYAFGTTYLPATTITTDTTWSPAGGPFVLNGDLTVAAGVTLTLDPGVVVKLNGQYRQIRVNGKILARGTPAKAVLITSAQDDAQDAGGDTNGDGTTTSGAPGQWYGIWIYSGGSSFENTEIRDGAIGSGGTYAYGAVNISGGTTTFNRVFIHDNQYAGIRVNPFGTPLAAAEVDQSLIAKNGTGIASINGRVRVTGSHIVENKDDGLFFNLGMDYANSGSTILNNEIAKNGRYAVNIWNYPSLAAGLYPTGHRNNILGNNTANSYNQPWQLQVSSGNHPDVSWENNYWGVDQAGPVKRIFCPATPPTKNPNHLVYGDDPSLTDTNVPSGPIPHSIDYKMTPDYRSIDSYCGSDIVQGYPFSANPFRIPIFGFVPLSPAAEQYAATAAYRPFLFFDEHEHFQPVTLDAFFSEEDPQFPNYHVGFHWACSGADVCWRATSTDDLNGADRIDVGQDGNDPPGSWFSPRAKNGSCAHGSFLDCVGEPYAGMYYNRTVVGTTMDSLRSYWDYWWFYRYNDYTALPWGDNHEGDWEGMTVVTDAENPDGTASNHLLWVVYAEHQMNFRYFPSNISFTGLHPHGFPSDGGHATYPYRCATGPVFSCSNDANPEVPEGDHGGEIPGTLNDSCSSCVLRFPETVEAVNDPTVPPIEGKAGWNALHIKWGSSGSPPGTPGDQPRYKEPWVATDVPQQMAMGRAETTTPATLDEADCGSWFGPGVVALACDKGRMQRALDDGTFGLRRGPMTIRVSTASKVGRAPGLVQVVGRPLVNGATLRIVGRTSKRAEIRVRVRIDAKHTAVARFLPARIRRGSLRVDIARLGRRTFVRLVRENGRVLVPAFVQLER